MSDDELQSYMVFSHPTLTVGGCLYRSTKSHSYYLSRQIQVGVPTPLKCSVFFLGGTVFTLVSVPYLRAGNPSNIPYTVRTREYRRP